MLFVDAHVHIYPCFHLKSFLSKALENFENAFGRPSLPFGKNEKDSAVLVLTEVKHENQFAHLLRLSENMTETVENLGKDWVVCPTKESHSLYISNKNIQGIFIIAGQQIITKENIEILSVGTTTKIKHGKPADVTLKQLNEIKSLAVIPWGFGKWMGTRGQIVENLIERDFGFNIYIGDNGNRPIIWPQPTLFKKAEEMGIENLPGSDPLPIHSHEGRAGSYGFSLNGSLDPNYPAHTLKSMLENGTQRPKKYGKRQRPAAFFSNQFLMQWLKLKNKKQH